jgi:hypothetical protein
MIVVLGHIRDSVARRVYAALQNQGLPSFWFNVDRLGEDFVVDEWGFHWQGGELAFDRIESVYNRILKIAFKDQVASMWGYLMWWLDEADSFVVNRPQAVMSNFFKPSQLPIIAQYFTVPSSRFVANDYCYAQGQVVKSISSVPSRVQLFAGGFVYEPVLLQDKIDGYHVRVHVVGSEVVACRIDAEDIDYRCCSKAVFSPLSLGAVTHECAVALSRRLGAHLTGIDFIVRDGEWVCLEVNTSPGFTFYDDRMGQESVLSKVVTCLKSPL